LEKTRPVYNKVRDMFSSLHSPDPQRATLDHVRRMDSLQAALSDTGDGTAGEDLVTLKELSDAIGLAGSELSDAYATVLQGEKGGEGMVEELEKVGRTIDKIVELVEGSNLDLGRVEEPERPLLSAGRRRTEKSEMPNLEAGEHVLRARNPHRDGDYCALMPEGRGIYGRDDKEWERRRYEAGRTERAWRQDEDICRDDIRDDGGLEHRRMQCGRLMCAQNYNLYDLFVFMYGDDIDFATGNFDKNIKNFDERQLVEQLSKIKSLVGEIKSGTVGGDVPDEFLLEGGKCDDLLSEFHRFDEEIGVDGKWAGGSVTAVCRGWGTTKYVSLESMFRVILIDRDDPEIAANLVVDVFEEFVGCTGIMGERLGWNNPYVDGDTLSIPLGIQRAARDDKGQVNETTLNLFRNVTLGKDEGNVVDDGGNVTFSVGLKAHLLDLYVKNGEQQANADELFDPNAWIDLLPNINSTNAKDIEEAKIKAREEYDEKIAAAKVYLAEAAKNGQRVTSLDTSIALVFGNKTTIGQVCSYSQGMDTDEEDALPGYCCMDAPYESDYWGETYSCIHRTGEFKGEAKNSTTDCNTLAPFSTGLNDAACDSFSGTWCPNPRDCQTLNGCIADLTTDAETKEYKQAYFEYLDAAPKISDLLAANVEECQAVREYFEYDKNYPDDQRICDEVEAIQCFEDFSNLDGYATGTVGSGFSQEDAITLELTLTTTEPFDGDIKQWKSLNDGLSNALDILELAPKIAAAAEYLCVSFTSAFPGTAAVCAAAASIIKAATETAASIGRKALAVSERLYTLVVTFRNEGFSLDLATSVYDNVIFANKNIRESYTQIKELKQLLGDALEEEDEDTNSTLFLAEQCGTMSLCSQASSPCQCPDIDPRNNCNCTRNYEYISRQRGAGCDNFDSDGNGVKDDCEDRFPPSILVTNTDIFRCDPEDVTKLCYDKKVFSKDKYARDFLEYQMKATDDCAQQKSLDIIIEQSGTCAETVYTLTPLQNIADCANTANAFGHELAATQQNSDLPFQNPLNGMQKMVTLQVDAEDPIIECGFHDTSSLHVVENKTLFYYVDSYDTTPKDANFFYNITENCPADVQVDVSVKSNELERGETTVNLYKQQESGFVQQPTLYFTPTSCKEQKKKSPECEADPSIDPQLRFYEITVTATDTAGRVGTDTCRIVVVPRCNCECDCGDVCQKEKRPCHASKSKSKRRTKEDVMDVAYTYGNYFLLDYVSTVAESSALRYDLASSALVWEGDLDPPRVVVPPPTTFWEDAFY